MPPAVAPWAQVRWAPASVGPQRHPHLSDPLLKQYGLDQHLARKFHAQPVQAQSFKARLRQCAKAAVSIVDLAVKQKIEESRKDRIADVAVHPRHGAGRNAALEARAHTDIRPVHQGFYHWHGLAEVIGTVSIAHDEEAPFS